MTSRDAQRLWDALTGKDERRVVFKLEEIHAAFAIACPHLADQARAREHLSAILAELAAEKLLRPPATANRRAYDRAERIALPKTITRLDRGARPVQQAILWRPELGFAREIGALHRDELLAIQEWLRASGGSAPQVALRERSVEIFGDEKRFDALLGTQLFRKGRLTLELLRCYLPQVPIYVVPLHPAVAGPLLVVENHTTFHTLCRWNEAHRYYRAVAYGGGAAFVASCLSLTQHLDDSDSTGELLYFGDLDPKGLWIPARAAENNLPIHPEAGLYRGLLHAAETNSRLPTRQFSFDPAVLEWLPPELRLPVARHFDEGRRLPQELLTLPLLNSI